MYQTTQFGRRILSRQFQGWHQEFRYRQILKKAKPLSHKVLHGWHRLVETRAFIRSLIPKNRSYFARWRECWLIARAQARRTKEALAESFSSWRTRTNLEKLARPLNQVVLRQAATFWLDAHREFQALIRGVPQLSPIFQDILNFRKQGLAVALKVLKQHSRQRKSLELLEIRVQQDQRLRVLGLCVNNWSLHVRQLRAHQFHRKTLCSKLMVAWQRGARESQSRGALRKLAFVFRQYSILSYWRRSAQVASRAGLCLQRVRSHTVHQVWRAWLHFSRLRGLLRDLEQSQSEAQQAGLKNRIWHQWWGDFQKNWEPYSRYRLKEGQNLKLIVWKAWTRLIYQSAKLRDSHFLKACLQAWRLVSQEKKMIDDLMKSARQLGYSRNSEFSRSGISRDTQNSMTSSTDTRFLKSFEDALETPFEYRLDRRRSVG